MAILNKTKSVSRSKKLINAIFLLSYTIRLSFNLFKRLRLSIRNINVPIHERIVIV